MKLPTDVIFRHDLRLMVWRPRGVVNEKAVNGILKFMGEEESTSHKPFNRFTDALQIETVDLSFQYVFHISLFRRLSYAGRLPIKSAILVANQEMARYSRLHQMLTQGSPIKVRIFEEREKVAKWLDVAIETLEY